MKLTVRGQGQNYIVKERGSRGVGASPHTLLRTLMDSFLSKNGYC